MHALYNIMCVKETETQSLMREKYLGRRQNQLHNGYNSYILNLVYGYR